MIDGLRPFRPDPHVLLSTWHLQWLSMTLVFRKHFFFAFSFSGGGRESNVIL